MPYRYLEDIAISDVAFEAEGASLVDVFRAAAEATTGAMVEDCSDIEPEEMVTFEVKALELDLLLYDFLGELVFLKDARGLLLRVESLCIDEVEDGFSLKARVAGEHINREKHSLRADVKAVTLHRFTLERSENGWKARVVLDV